MKRRQISDCQRKYQGPQTVWVLPVEIHVRDQLARHGERELRPGLRHLRGKPFVDDQAVGLPLIIETLDRAGSVACRHKLQQGAVLFGHVVGIFILGASQFATVQPGGQCQRGGAQCAFGRGVGVR